MTVLINEDCGNMLRLREILNAELNAAGLSVRSWKRNGGGSADFNLEIVDIPRPKNEYLLGVAFHEIGHIHLNRSVKGYSSMPRYVMEYMAECYAIEKLKQYKLSWHEYRLYATKYVIMCMASYKNSGHRMLKIPADIVRWTGIDAAAWKAAKKVSVCIDDRTFSKVSDIRISYEN